MPSLDLDKLERFAREAKAAEEGTQHFIRYDHGGGRAYFEAPRGGLRGSVNRGLIADVFDEAHRELIFALTTDTVLALIERVRELEAVATFGVCNKCGWGGPIDAAEDFHPHPDCRYSAVAIKERVP